MLRVPAATAGVMPMSRRYGTIWKLMVPDMRMTSDSAMMMSQNAGVRDAWLALQSCSGRDVNCAEGVVSRRLRGSADSVAPSGCRPMSDGLRRITRTGV